MGRKRDETFSEFVREQLHKLGLRLDDIVTQNRATIEAVQVSRAALEERIDRYDGDSRERDGAVVERLDERVSALERRAG